jgi:prolipoprotein diacylglyceryltransferase
VHPVLFTVGGLDVRSHDVFVLLGVLAALAVFNAEVRRRDAWDDRLYVVVAVTLFCGAVGMRASGLVRHLDPSENPAVLDGLRYGAKSILGGLTGAYGGALLGKRIAGYESRTGDLFAPAVAIGMAVGRIGCLLAEAPGRPTSLPWGVHVPAAYAGSVGYCPGCATGAAMHPSFVYEIAFHLLAFAALWRLRGRPLPAGETLTLYLAAYGVFRFAVEFTRANETVWLGLTRPQWFLVPTLTLMLWHLRRKARAGTYAGLRRPRRPALEPA